MLLILIFSYIQYLLKKIVQFVKYTRKEYYKQQKKILTFNLWLLIVDYFYYKNKINTRNTVINYDVDYITIRTNFKNKE